MTMTICPVCGQRPTARCRDHELRARYGFREIASARWKQDEDASPERAASERRSDE